MTKLENLFSAVFVRSSPLIEAETSTLVAVSLMRFHQIDALLIIAKKRNGDSSESRRNCTAITGFSILRNLLRTDTRDYYEFLFRPCERCAMRLHSISVEEWLTALIKTFEETRFGIACLEAQDIHGLISLQDLLLLYKSGFLRTSLSVRDVASPIFQLPGSMRLNEALKMMVRRRIRRVFLSANTYITDRDIISYIFSPKRLRAVRDSPESMLDCTLAEIQTREAIRCEGGTSIEEASGLVGPGDCLVCDEGLVTPWDLVVKPWMMGKLSIGTGSYDSAA